MHKTEISQETLDAAARRRGGRRYAFADIDPTKTALIVIDMQKYFMEPGMAAEVPIAREIVPNINKLASSLRSAGGQVAWVITTFDENTFDDWSVVKDLFSTERCQAMIENLSIGGPGHALWPEFEVNDQDWNIDKNRFSAFINNSSDLEKRLKGAGIDTVIITGTLTDVCCESSARDAMMCNFKTIMITDANAASSDDDHNNALNAVARLFVDVLSTDEMITRLHEN
jgi:ureidoacrylate peracid hydrolase